MRQDFYECISDLTTHSLVMQMTKYLHHGNINCYQHCLYVSYYNYRICLLLGLRAREAARTGMLHDLFLYDCHIYAKETGKHFYGIKDIRILLIVTCDLIHNAVHPQAH